MSADTLAGIVVLTRHGDRQGFYQSPKTYTPSLTNLTVLGYRQQLYNGGDLRARYLLPDSTTPIQGIDANVAENTQVSVIADAGGEGGVIVESANALMQGLFPPYNENITLANGTVVSWDGRAQLIPIETIEPDQSVVMEGWTECSAWTDRLNSWYATDAFKSNAKNAESFYNSIADILGERPRKLENAWNIFDFLNVERIHDADLAPRISDQILEQAAGWAGYHENGAFSDSDLKQIGNVAGQGVLTPILEGIHRVSNTSDPLKMSVIAGAYKPFLSLFKMLSMPEQADKLVLYASTLVFEVHTDSTLSLSFRNGSAGDFVSPTFMDSTRMRVAEFESRLRPYAIEGLAEWCDACKQTSERGCAELYRLNGTGSDADYAPATSTSGQHAVSPVVAGLIGAFVSLAVAAAILGAISFLSGITVSVSKRRRNHLSRNPGPIRLSDDASSFSHRRSDSLSHPAVAATKADSTRSFELQNPKF